ncbi:four helix bundle protein [Leeuwenhoekiella sp. A16]|uniref:four helix bundle protein n=1 Tax=unclassified Leeuwenhoekiella TaxID=2615029 RepID=UPI003A7FE62B
MGNLQSFEELSCRQEARILRNFVKDVIVPTFPEKEKYSLQSQIIRSSRSIGNNVAEGFGRFHFQENIQFCRMARGSLFETLDHFIIARDEGYISPETAEEFRGIYGKTLLILNGYIKYLKRKKTE